MGGDWEGEEDGDAERRPVERREQGEGSEGLHPQRRGPWAPTPGRF